MDETAQTTHLAYLTSIHVSFTCISTSWAMAGCVTLPSEWLADSQFAVQQLKPSEISDSRTANISHNFPKLPNLNQLMFSNFYFNILRDPKQKKKSFGSDNCILVNQFKQLISSSCVTLLAAQISSRNWGRTLIQTQVFALTWRLYRNWKLLGLLAASFTAWASSMQPCPPWAQWWHGTASDAPHSFAIWHTRSTSAWVSVLSINQWKQCYRM